MKQGFLFELKAKTIKEVQFVLTVVFQFELRGRFLKTSGSTKVPTHAGLHERVVMDNYNSASCLVRCRMLPIAQGPGCSLALVFKNFHQFQNKKTV